MLTLTGITRVIVKGFKVLLITRGFLLRRSGLREFRSKRSSRYRSRWRSLRFGLFATLISCFVLFVDSSLMQSLGKVVGCAEMQLGFM
mmetsp:Transcript_31570/g.5704  ORF Transcript_31570/g.5704 Transcript_31570/m.5704 type:complete len:88 (-) Transcript_31570:158-421(-)